MHELVVAKIDADVGAAAAVDGEEDQIAGTGLGAQATILLDRKSVV